jgi:hypothetical protein
MGLGIKQNILPGTGRHHLFQDPGDPGIIQAGVELTIREGTGTSFAKLDIGFRILNTGLSSYRSKCIVMSA